MRIYYGFNLFGVPWLQWLTTMGPLLARDPEPILPNPLYDKAFNPAEVASFDRQAVIDGLKPAPTTGLALVRDALVFSEPAEDSMAAMSPVMNEENELLLICSSDTTDCKLSHEQSCPISTTFCNSHCCPEGTSCCGTGCCPNDVSICDNAKGAFCPKGHQCFEGRHCCPDGTTYCGGACVTGPCCSDEFFCRGAGETCCGGPAKYVPEPNWRYGPWRTGYGVGFGRDQVNSPLVKTGGWRCCSGCQVCHEGKECRWRPKFMGSEVEHHPANPFTEEDIGWVGVVLVNYVLGLLF
ncbi:hypothetical protein ACRALDRAFT_1066561 [Sodiomyces alcalophilus JCM 7366]|uniref:uncharacterized protein n=1 Tax=Sodiomyces alcalophilus JCM 7366 TaxID=591952 RepID=UPI0039B5B3D4